MGVSHDGAMNILMLTDVYFPRVNGVSTSIRTHVRELAARGHSVTLVAPDYPGASPEETSEVIRLPSRTIFFDPEDRLMHGGALRAILHALAARPWDVIHVHTPFQAHRLGTWLRRRTGTALVETYHTYFEQYVGHYLPWMPGIALRSLARTLSRRLCADTDHLIVPSAEMETVLRRYGIATPSTVIPTGIHLEEFSGGDGLRFRLAHGIAVDRPTLVTVSRLAREKNIAFLIEVVAALQPMFPDLLFIVAGEGPDAQRLRALATAKGLEHNVCFFGNLDRRSALLDCYRAGDVFVFASPTETQGLVLLEALALGVPVVSTAVMGTASVLAGAQGAVVAHETVAGFAATVASLLRDADRRRVLSSAGPVDAARWGAAALVERVEELYGALSLLSRARRAA